MHPSIRTLSVSAGWVVLASASLVCSAQPCDPTSSMPLLPADGTPDDQFGWSIAVDGDTAVVGAWKDSDAGDRHGSVYVFARSGETWALETKLLAADVQTLHRYGWAVGVSGDTIVVGAFGDGTNGVNSGAAYIYTRTDTGWAQQAKLFASDARSNLEFGRDVAIDADTVVIGAPGDFGDAAYVFTRDGTAWSQQARLTNGAAPTLLSDFGFSVDISADTVVVGDYIADDFAGAAYVFTRDAGVWSLQGELIGQEVAPADVFGRDVAIDGDTVIVGAYEDDNNGTRSGSAFIFHRTGSAWAQQAWLLPGDGNTGDFFGVQVDIDAERCVVGSINSDDAGDNAGSVYVYARSNGVWYPQDELYKTNPANQDRFGSSVALSGATLAAGAPRAASSGPDSGYAEIFALACAPCPTDLNKDGTLDFFDVTIFLNAYIAQSPVADFTRDNEFSFFDVALYFQLFSSGCP